jgi:hypothetical protein
MILKDQISILMVILDMVVVNNKITNLIIVVNFLGNKLFEFHIANYIASFNQ